MLLNLHTPCGTIIFLWYQIAKARQRELRERQAASAEPSTSTNANHKRPLEVTSVLSKSPTGPHKRSYEKKEGEAEPPLKRNSRLSNYYEYDLSKMVNSKGGFLVDEDGGNGREIDEDTRRLEQLREKERIEKNAEPRKPTSVSFRYNSALILASVRFLDPSLNPKCRECNSMDVDHVFRATFRCSVCNSCKNTYPEKYSLLTKTECKEVCRTVIWLYGTFAQQLILGLPWQDYLLTDRRSHLKTLQKSPGLTPKLNSRAPRRG